MINSLNTLRAIIWKDLIEIDNDNSIQYLTAEYVKSLFEKIIEGFNKLSI